MAGDDTEGIYVIASDIGAQKADPVAVGADLSALSVVTLLVAGWVAHGVIGRLLRPLASS